MFSSLIVAAKPPGLPEKLLCCFVIGLFGLIGIGLLRAAIRELHHKNRCRKRLIRLPATVVTVRKERVYQSGKSAGSRTESNYVMKFFPVIAFTNPEGMHVEFRSELGESHRIRHHIDGSEIIRQPSWQDGQKTEVFFDPAGEMKPCLATGWSLWFMGIGMLAAGVMFLGASVMMCILFVPKVFA